GGRFGQHDGDSVDVETAAAVGFSSTLWLERPELSIRVVDLSAKLDAGAVPALLRAELESDAQLSIAGYDERMRRHALCSKVLHPDGYAPRNIAWSGRDVVLVTGGAKGITAECALALATQTGARFALVGSSDLNEELDSNSEIRRNLERFEYAGVQHKYYSCDITDPDAVSRLVASVKEELGPVTAVIHGAGVNRPRPAGQVSADEALREVAPKLMGAVNLCKALKHDPPRMILAMSSIIGITGMRGNAWYAFSNEALDLTLRRFAVRHPDTSVVSLAYSVWGEVGMGHRLGVVKNLEQTGVGAIPTEEGVKRFLHHMNADSGYKQVVIAGRLGGLPTWRLLRGRPVSTEDMRFVETVVDIEPGVEMTAGCTLTTERDLYLRDHDFHGSFLFPTVFGLEAMAQAACALTGHDPATIIGFEAVSLQRPVVVGEGNGTAIRLNAFAMERDERGVQRVRVGLRAEQTGFGQDHFSATVLFGRPEAGPVRPAVPREHRLALDPQADLYGKVLFQGPLFQRLESVYALGDDHVVFGGESRETLFDGENGFAAGEGGSLLVGDPFFRDVLLQSVQIPLVPEVVLPIGIGAIEIYSDPLYENGRRIATATLKSHHDREYSWDIVVTNDGGRVVEVLRDYRVKVLEGYQVEPGRIPALKSSDAPAEDFAGQVAAMPAALVDDAPLVRVYDAPGLHALLKEDRHVRERPMIDETAKAWLHHHDRVEEVPDLVWESSGKPRFRGRDAGDMDLSLAHDDRFCLCVVGKGPLGCDIEPVTHRTLAEWSALLSDTRMTMLEVLERRGDDTDTAGTRLWCAVEAARKAFSGHDPQLELAGRVEGAIVFDARHGGRTVSVVTGRFEIGSHRPRVVALAMAVDGDSAPAAEPVSPAHAGAAGDAFYLEEHASRMVHDPALDQEVFEYIFQPTFKESANLGRTIIYTSYLLWIGKVRELFMAEIGRKLVKQISSGEWG
ncbi:MAG TPA: SDR family NAD(P)-dependent oxidoreductase, partial [Gammaproteobacteria bacterium]|nr:SDR family NAD(P)-dependent oxidoreductase [Gammaproteobacteria bacterium]